MKRRTIKGIIAAICIIQALNTSCEVGLGSAVDTQAPGLTIGKPEVDMVIREKFVMSGEWEDDGVIDSVYVMVKRTDGNPVNHMGAEGSAQKEVRIDGSFEKSEEEKGKGKWKAEVDPFCEENPIPDGTYQATVYIKDKGNHLSSQSTTFTVDNTPPVLILTKPASKPGDSTTSKYGKRLFLEGKVADSTKETWIEIKYYNRADCSEESLLSTMQTQLIAPTDVNSNNAKLASFSEDLNDELAREYFDIYKDENGGDKEGKAGTSTVYAALTVYDTAETCKEESGENEGEGAEEAGESGKIRGNSTGTFYFSKELSTSITKSKESGGYGLAPTDIYNILNGNYEIKNSSRAAEAEAVEKELTELRKDREGERDITVFTINPENSPYFTVSGLKTLSGQSMEVSDNGYFLINGAMTLEISVFMGSDSIELDSDSRDFYAYLLESDEYGEPLEGAEEIKLYSKARESGSGKDKKTYYEIGGKEEHQTTTGAYVFSVPMAKSVRVNPDAEGTEGIVETGIEYGKNYVIRVSGKDMEDNPVEVYDTGYGFHFTSGGGAPELEIEEPHEGTLFIKKGEGVTFSGRAKTEEGAAEVSVWNGETKLTDLEMETREEGKFNRFSGRVEAEKFDQEEGGIYTLTVKAAAGGDNEGATEYQRTIWYDVEEPKASNIKVSEKKEGEEAYKDSYTDGEKYYVNNQKKIIGISGIATDNVGLKSAVLTVSGEGGKKIEKKEEEAPGKWSFEGIDLRDWSGDEAEAELLLEDKSGNTSVTKIEIKFDVRAPVAEHKIDDASKDLSFRIGDYENDAGESDVGGKYSQGTYGSALTMQIRGSYPDEEGGSGLKRIYYSVFEDEVTIEGRKENGEKEGGKIYFKSLDDLKEYVIAHKTDTFTPLSVKETRNVEYNIKPGSLPATAENTVNRYGGEAVNGYSVNSKGYVQFRTAVESNYKATIKGFQEGKNYLVIAAEDNAGNTSIDSAEVPTPQDPTKTAIYPCYSLNVDITAPSIPTKQSGTVYTNLAGTTPVTISGTVTDKSGAEDGSSGLSKIVFTSDQTNKTVTVYSTEFEDVEESENPNGDPTLKKWTADIRTLLGTDGNAIISAKVSDKVGYETSAPVANVMVDQTSPVVSISTPSYNAKTGTSVNISGTVNDGTGSGVDTAKPMILYYTKNATAGLGGLTEETEAVTDAAEGWVKLGQFTAGTSGSWSYELDAESITTDGENSIRFFTVSATDKAGEGNTGIAEAVRITVDRKKPVMEDEVSGIGNVRKGENVNGHWFNARTLKVAGKYKDEGGSGVSSVSYRIGSGEAEEVSTTNGSYSINVSDFTEGENILTVWAEDAAGNRSEETEYTFSIDSIQPEIEEVTGEDTTKGEDVVLSVKIKDANAQKPSVTVKQNGTAVEATQEVRVSEGAGSGNEKTYSVTIPFASAITTDGTYEIEIGESDRAGNSATAVSKRILRDSIAPVITIDPAETEEGAYIKAGSYTFKGSITDAGGGVEGYAKVYSINGESETQFGATQTIDLQADGSWVLKVYELTAGEYKIKVKAGDRAGNEAEEKESYRVKIDNTAPVITVTSSQTGGKADLNDAEGNESITLLSDRTYYAKGDYQIKVSVNDTNFDYSYETADEGGNPQKLFKVRAKNNNQEAKNVTIEEDSTDEKAFIFRPEEYEDGIFTYEIEVHDKAGNQANPAVIKVQRDTTGPAVSIKSPAADITEAKDSLSEETYSFRIHAEDGSGVGVAKLYYVFSQEGPGQDGSIPEVLRWKEESFTDGDRNIDMPLAEGREAAADTDGNITSLCEGKWYLYAKAVDKSGNGSDVKVRSFPVDRRSPSLTVSGLNESGVNALYKEITDNKYELSGSVSDTNALAETDAVVVSIDDKTPVSASVSGTSWTYELDVGTEEGTLKKDELVSVKVTAKDLAGRTTSKSYTLYYDTKDPELEITAPVEDEAVETDTKVIKGTVSDGGYGIRKLEYKLYRGSETTAFVSGDTDHPDADYPIAIKGEQWYISKNEGKIPLGTTEGSLRLEVTATENKPEGAEAVTGTREYVKAKTVDFYYDTANPELTEGGEEGVGTTGKTTNAAFKLSGTASDINALASVTIKWKVGNADKSITLTPTESQLNSMTWSQEFKVGTDNSGEANYVADGTNEFTITAKDIAGKEKQLNRTVVVDTVNPVCGTASITPSGKSVGTGDAAKTWYKTNTLSVTGNVSDTDGSGVTKVECTFKTDDSSWTPLSINRNADGTYTYSGSITFDSDGEGKQIRVKATDAAGNTSISTTTGINIDTQSPSTEEDLTERKVNGKDATKTILTFDVKEANSGITAEDFKVYLKNTELTLTEETAGGAETTGNRISIGEATGSGSSRKYSVTIQIGTAAFEGLSGSYPVKVAVTDGAGNPSAATIIGTLNVDRDDPVPAIASHKASDTVNQTIELSGRITDASNSAIESISLKAEGNSKPVNFVKVEKTDTNAGKHGYLTYENGQWSAVLDTTKLYDGEETKDLALTLEATDDAGNKGSTGLSLTIDQNSDRPVIKMNQIRSDGEGYLPTKTVFGSVTDDDGNIKKLWVWSTGLNNGAEPSSAPALTDSGAGPSGWIAFGTTDSGSTLENSNWQIESKDTDGQTTWFWAVADAEDNIFWTKADSGLTQPYITYSDKTKQENTAGISLKYDTNAPEIKSVELVRLPSATYKTGTTRYKAAEIQEYMDEQHITWSAEDKIAFGKDKGLMYMRVRVEEKTGMAASPLKIMKGSEEYLEVTEELRTVSKSEDIYTYILGPFDMKGKGSEEVSLVITATDGAGKTGNKDKKLVADNSADIIISKAEPKPDAEKSGEFDFQASVSDSLSSIASVEYSIPPYSTYSVWDEAATEGEKETVLKLMNNWTEIEDVSLSFKIEFSGNNIFSKIIGYETNGAEAVVSDNFKNYDTGLAAGAAESGIYLVPVWFRVKDEVGNTAYISKAKYSNKSNGQTEEEEKDIKVKYNPNTDRPAVVITDPEITADGVEKGGNIKIAGTASDNEGISEVYLQFDFGSGSFDNGSLTDETDIPHTGTTPLRGVKASGTRNWNYKLDASELANGTVIRVRAIAVDSDMTDPLVSAWSDVLKIKINNSIPSFENLYIRQRADGSPTGNVLVSREYDASGMFIKGTGWFLEGTAYTSSSDHLTKLQAGLYTWTGNGTTLTEGSSNPSSPAGYAEYESVTVTVGEDEVEKNRKINFRIPVSGETEWTVTVTAEDANNPAGSANQTYTVDIDNTAPSFPDLYEINSEGEDNKKGIRLYRDSYGSASNLLGDANFLQNSNGSSFTLAGKIIEEGSGFDKAVFYIMRKGSDSVNRIYDPRESHGTDNRGNRTDIAEDEDLVTAEKPVYINSDNLPVRKVTVTNSAAEAKLTAGEINTDTNIRTGGLVYIGGLYRTITSVDRTAGFVTINPAYDGSETQAQFVYALVVDHSGEGENSDGSIRNDDGDGLLESFSGSQAKNYSWEASFNSANIPDGPVEIHVVTFDQAGNIGYGYTKTRASNNAPRITKVMLGTDLNGNGRYDFGSGEFGTFYNQKDDFGNAITKTGTKNWDLKTAEHIGDGTASWKVKNGLAVIAEFVGGAGPFYYKFTKDADVIEEGQKISENKTDLTSDYLESYKLKESGQNDLITLSGTTNKASWSYSTNKVNNADVTNNGGSLTLTNAQIGTGSNEDTDVYFRFTFWDSTEDSTPGYDTGYTILNLKVTQDLADNAEPDAAIKPFEWDGTGFVKEVTKTVDGVKDPDGSSTNIVEILEAGDIPGTKTSTSLEDGKTVVTTTVITPKNSLYGASRANGHIELESDLTADITGNGTGQLNMGSDPKVSGKITFHGTAKDDTRLSSIWFKFTDFTATGLTQTTTEGVTKFDTATDALTGYTQAAWYNPATASWENAPATMAGSHWEFTASDSSFDQNGHCVDWYLSIDTAYITDTVGLDKALSVIVLDAASTQNASTASSYGMDVVPYVSSLTTSLSGFQSSNPSVYDRTALGHYPVYMTHAQGNGAYTYETVEVNGFNLYGTKMKFENVAVPAAIGAYKDQAADGTYPAATSLDETKHYRVTLPADLKSGKITVWNGDSGTIKSLNNLNNNDANGKVTGSTTTEAGGYSGCYNRLPNGINNNRLTDDLVIDVWDLNSEAAKAYADTKADNAVMKINPKSGMIGFAFSNGSERFSMGGKLNSNEYSYHVWNMTYDMMNYNYFAYDTEGNSYATTSGGDINTGTPKWDFFSFMADRWGQVLDYNGTISDRSNINDNASWSSSPGKYNICTEGIGQKNSAISTSTGNFIRKDRIQSTSIATLRNEKNDGTYIYMAYYDFINDEIRFRFCNFLDTYNTATQKGADWGTFKDVRSKDKGITDYAYSAGSGQIVATNTLTGDYARSKTLGAAGNSVSIGVTSDNVVVMVWYNSEENKLMYSYNTTPTTKEDEKEDGTKVSRLGASKAGWATDGSGAPFTLIQNAGEYCQLVVDGNNGIHVVAYDSGSGDLKYAYLSSYNDASPKVCTVDSYLDVGTQLSLDVAAETKTVDGQPETCYIPHIGYWASYPEKPRYAYLYDVEAFEKSTTENARSGAVSGNDKYTGIWECGIVPGGIDSDIKEGKINVALWKADVTTGEDDSAVTVKGKRVESNYTTFTANDKKSSDSSAENDKGYCYGNGTDNAVLAYVVMPSSSTYHIETAQMR